jgi:hypothetical protein
LSFDPSYLSPQLKVQESGHPQEIEKTEEEGREAACGFGEIGENCDFHQPSHCPVGIGSKSFDRSLIELFN